MNCLFTQNASDIRMKSGSNVCLHFYMNETWLLCNSWKILREGGHYFQLSIVHSLIILSYIADQMSIVWPV